MGDQIENINYQIDFKERVRIINFHWVPAYLSYISLSKVAENVSRIRYGIYLTPVQHISF